MRSPEFGPGGPEVKDRIVSPKLKKAFQIAGTMALALTLLGGWKEAVMGVAAATGVEQSLDKKQA